MGGHWPCTRVETGCASGWKLAVPVGGNWLCQWVETGWKLAVPLGGNWLCQWVETGCASGWKLAVPVGETGCATGWKLHHQRQFFYTLMSPAGQALDFTAVAA